MKVDPRRAKRDEIAASIHVKRPEPCNKRAETVDEWRARTGQEPEKLPCTLSPPSQYGRFNGTTRMVAGHAPT